MPSGARRISFPKMLVGPLQMQSERERTRHRPSLPIRQGMPVSAAIPGRPAVCCPIVGGRQIGVFLMIPALPATPEDPSADERTSRHAPCHATRSSAGRRVHDRRRDRARGHGGRLPGARRAAAAARRDQGPPSGAGLPGRDPAALHARGADRRAALPPEHRPDPRRRRGRRAGLLRHGPGGRRIARRRASSAGASCRPRRSAAS